MFRLGSESMPVSKASHVAESIDRSTFESVASAHKIVAEEGRVASSSSPRLADSLSNDEEGRGDGDTFAATFCGGAEAAEAGPVSPHQRTDGNERGDARRPAPGTQYLCHCTTDVYEDCWHPWHGIKRAVPR